MFFLKFLNCVGVSKVFTTLLNFYLKDFRILARAFLCKWHVYNELHIYKDNTWSLEFTTVNRSRRIYKALQRMNLTSLQQLYDSYINIFNWSDMTVYLFIFISWH